MPDRKAQPKENREYWLRIREWALGAGSDGCTMVPDTHLECCWEHDKHWGGTDIDGNPISRAETNRLFRECIQNRSKFGRFSPMSWWRWVGVWIGTGWEKVSGK